VIVGTVPGWVMTLGVLWIAAMSAGMVDVRVQVGRILQRLDDAGNGSAVSTRARNGRGRRP
jgi:UPF0716 family protein affecting phage T7 exclusion